MICSLKIPGVEVWAELLRTLSSSQDLSHAVVRFFHWSDSIECFLNAMRACAIRCAVVSSRTSGSIRSQR